MTEKKKVTLSDTYIESVVSKKKQQQNVTNTRKTAPEGGRVTRRVTQYSNETDDVFKCWLQEKIEKEKELRRQREEQERVKREVEKERERIRAEAAGINRKRWLKKKEEENKRKELEKKKLREKEELKKKEREAKSKECMKAWIEAAKYKPKPPINKGLASLMCNNVRPMNRIPWKNIIECGAD